MVIVVIMKIVDMPDLLLDRMATRKTKTKTMHMEGPELCHSR